MIFSASLAAAMVMTTQVGGWRRGEGAGCVCVGVVVMTHQVGGLEEGG
jgi:hypothetical protein